ncbi:ThiF family adenylyltransferase [Dechloromonas denitrificans]|uniref:ThiF family adenylyltransferase n=1 Tax=Dechloromonas denitrificans TaxID=281362 RepID=UPI001CF854A7|nr:ThiF family adenylyltransferase [Dechloromonas denitrificans]UCV01915.1 ThiF family adenylyltransferase [Dechloromonas denitrificans]UCV06249.1 ThiF family adenylyltransferase [Dechloromonas denitrificans]
MSPFNYHDAFSRNIGWVTENEQLRLRDARVAIGGLGGVGGVHLLTLARLGVGQFSIADFDVFDIVNFNRQVGANVSTLGRPKIDVLVEMAQDINPEIQLTTFPAGIQADSLEAFLDGVDVYVDGLDFFAFDARRMTFAACEKKGIPVVTAAPLGMGTALLVFGPGGMSAEDYFGFEGGDEMEMAIRFLVGLSPAMLQRGYVVDMSRVNLAERKGPSSIAACQLCAGVAAIETLKLLLGRSGVKLAPWGSQFDAYRMRYVRTWRPWGHRNPLQRLMIALVKAQLGRSSN